MNAAPQSTTGAGSGADQFLLAVIDWAPVPPTVIAIYYAVHAARLACGCPRSELECIAAARSLLTRRWAALCAHSRRWVSNARGRATLGR